LRGAEQVVPGIGQADAAPGAVEQRLLQVAFQAADLLADRRLGEVQRLGGLVETAQAGSGFETAQGVERGPVFEHADKPANQKCAKSIVCRANFPAIAWAPTPATAGFVDKNP
jgi:hypothetical protein